MFAIARVTMFKVWNRMFALDFFKVEYFIVSQTNGAK